VAIYPQRLLVGRLGLEPATNGFASGGSQQLALNRVISQCHKGFQRRSVLNDSL
jgi:hypothetical protein